MSKSRRNFFRTTGALAAASTLAPHISAAAKTSRRKRIAMIITEVRKMSHGQHFLDRFLEGYNWQGRHHHPEVDLAALYVDQFPEKDLALERERRHNVRIYPTVEEA